MVSKPSSRFAAERLTTNGQALLRKLLGFFLTNA
jgi:hypothetical protein